MSRTESDRQLVVAHLHNVLLALRSNARFSSSHRFTAVEGDTQHPLTERVAAAHLRVLSLSGFATMSEEEILGPICDACTSEETGEPITGVALSAMISLLEVEAGFISEYGLMKLADAAYLSQNDQLEKPAQDAIVARVLQVFGLCARHPRAAYLGEDYFVELVRRVHAASSVGGGPAEVLRRLADQVMNAIVSSLFRLTVQNGAASSHGPSNSLSARDLWARDCPPVSGAIIMRYIAALLSAKDDADLDILLKEVDEECNRELSRRNGGSVAASDAGVLVDTTVSEDGQSLRTESPRKADAEQDSVSPIPAAQLAVSRSTEGSEVLSASRVRVSALPKKDTKGVEKRFPVASRQLKGLTLSHTALYTIDSASSFFYPEGKLLDSLRVSLCRSVLALGLSTEDSIVMSQLLRTGHLIAKVASKSMVPQFRAVIELLHLSPLSTAMQSTSGMPGSPLRSSASPRTVPAASPVAARSPQTSAFPSAGKGTFWTASSWRDMQERLEIQLESLAEFCSDPSFAAYCVAHYDLSLCSLPLLPQLCDILASYCVSDDVDDVSDVDGVTSSGTGAAGTGSPPRFGSPSKTVLSSGGSPSPTGSSTSSPPSSVPAPAVADAPGPPAAGAGSGGAQQNNNNSNTNNGSSDRLVLRRRKPVNQFQLIALSGLYAMLEAVATRVDWQVRNATECDSAEGGTTTTSSSAASGVGAALRRKRSVTNHIEQLMKSKEQLMKFAQLFEDDPVKAAIPYMVAEAEKVASSRNANHDDSERADAEHVENSIAHSGREAAQPRAEESSWAVDGATADSQTDTGNINVFKIPLPVCGATVGRFLFQHKNLLEKRKLGDYIGELGKEPTKPSSVMDPDGKLAAAWQEARRNDHMRIGSVRFFEDQLKAFMDGFDFNNKSLLMAVREMVYHTCLPREAQKIDRVMEAFATHWRHSNVDSGPSINPFQSVDGPFILSFSIIMLNTDLHSGKMDKCMSLDEFLRVNRDIDGGKKLSDEFLKGVYVDIRDHQIITADQIHLGFSNEVTWSLAMTTEHAPPSSGRSDSRMSFSADGAATLNSNIPLYPHQVALACNSPLALCPYDSLVFEKLWLPCLRAFDSMIDASEVSSRVPLKVLLSIAESSDAAAHEALTPSAFGAPTSGIGLHVLKVSLRGVRLLAQTAAALGRTDTIDNVLLTLLDFVPLNLFDAKASLVELGDDARAILCARSVFSLLYRFADHVGAIWNDIANFVLKAYLLGLFSIDGTFLPGESADAAPSSIPFSPYAPEKPYRQPSASHMMLSGVLLTNPGIVATGDSPTMPLVQAAFGRAGAGGAGQRDAGGAGNGSGWFSGLWGWSASADAKRREQGERSRESMMRAKLCMPGIHDVIHVCAGVRGAAAMEFISALCAAGTLQSTSEADGFAASYAIHFISALMARTPEARELGALEVYLTYASKTLSVMTSMVERPVKGSDKQNAARQGGEDHAGSGNYRPLAPLSLTAHEYWKSLTTRAVTGILDLAQAYAARKSTYGAFCQVLALLAKVSKETFTAVVAEPMAIALDNVVCTHLEFVSQASVEEMGALLAAVQFAGSRAPNSSVESRVAHTLATIVGQGNYDPVLHSQALIHALVQISLSSSAPASSTASARGSPTNGQRESDGARETNGRSESIPEAAALICKRLINASNDASETRKEECHRLWTLTLGGLSDIIANSAHPRDTSDALLCLQRCLLDTEVRLESPQAVHALYDTVLFPLVERLCAPHPARLQQRGDNEEDGVSSQSQGARGTSLFGAQEEKLSGRGAAEPDQQQQQRSSPTFTLTDMKSRIISLLPKPFLRYFPILSSSDEVFQELCQRIIGTLYALYTSSNNINGRDGSTTSPDPVDDATEVDIAVREAVEETLKNMIFVLSATMRAPEHADFLKRVPFFWTSTRNLIRPFDFSEPLLIFLEKAGF